MDAVQKTRNKGLQYCTVEMAQALSRSRFTNDVHSVGMPRCRAPFLDFYWVLAGAVLSTLCVPTDKRTCLSFVRSSVDKLLTTLMNGANLWYIQYRLTKPVLPQACLTGHAVNCVASATA